LDIRTLTLTLSSIVLAALAQITLKYGMSNASIQHALHNDPLLTAILTIAKNAFVVGGLFIFGLSAALWLLVLAKIDVTQAYPFIGFGLILTMAFGALLLGETLTPMRIVGTMIVIMGVLVVARS